MQCLTNSIIAGVSIVFHVVFFNQKFNFRFDVCSAETASFNIELNSSGGMIDVSLTQTRHCVYRSTAKGYSFAAKVSNNYKIEF